jgi:hypothetical protein
VTHLLDVVHERADRLEEAAELGALSEAGEVSLLGISLDSNDVLGRILAAARDLVALAVLGHLKRLGRAPIGILERLCAAVVDAVLNVLNDHVSTSFLGG